MDIDWSDNNLSFFLNDNKPNLLIGLNAFQGEGDLIDGCEIVIELEQEDQIFMTWTDSYPLNIVVVAGATGWGSDGDWETVCENYETEATCDNT